MSALYELVVLALQAVAVYKIITGSIQEGATLYTLVTLCSLERKVVRIETFQEASTKAVVDYTKEHIKNKKDNEE